MREGLPEGPLPTSGIGTMYSGRTGGEEGGLSPCICERKCLSTGVYAKHAPSVACCLSLYAYLPSILLLPTMIGLFNTHTLSSSLLPQDLFLIP